MINRMPIYHYIAVGDGCLSCRDGVDRLQRLADAAPASCSVCGATLTRVISAPQIVSGQAHRLSEKHAAKNGFTQYRRAGKGLYEKTAGKGPEVISGD